MSEEQPPEVAPPVDDLEALAKMACDLSHGHYVTACNSCQSWAAFAYPALLAAGYLSPTAVREREAAAWDAGWCVGVSNFTAPTPQPQGNPFKGGA